MMPGPGRIPPPPPLRPMRRFVTDLLTGGALMALLHLFVVQVSVVKGHSMEPSLWDGDRLVVDRISYAMMDVERFDLVVLRYPKDPSVDFVKRVVGLPGDLLALEDGKLYVNGEVVDMPCSIVPDRADMAAIRVPDGSYFVLGDNRPISCDSREFDFVPAEYMKGKVRARFWPLARAELF